MSEKYLLKITLREEFPHLEKENVLFQGVLRGTEDRDTSEHDNIMTNAKLNRFPRLQSGRQQLQLIISRRNSTVTYLKLHRQHHTFTFLMKNIALLPITFFVETLYFIR